MDDRVGKYCMLALALASSITVLLHVYYLRIGTPNNPAFTFWLPILILGFLALYSTATSNTKFPLIFILILSLTLHLIQFVRQPTNMIWNPDTIYAQQLVNKVIETGHWDFGYGTGQAFEYSYYPLFYIFQSILSLLPSFPPILVLKYSMAIINTLTLLTFYTLINGLFDLEVKLKNFIVFMFGLNPMFHAFNSYAHAESYAIILYPLILLYALQQRGSGRSLKTPITAVAILLMITVSMSHHFTSYMVAISLLVPTLLLFFVYRRFFGVIQLHFLAFILPLTWLMFIAFDTFTAHSELLLGFLSELTFIPQFVGYTASPAGSSLTYYPSAFSLQIALLRNVMLILFTFIGFFFYSHLKKKRAFAYLKALLFTYAGLTFLLLFAIDWSKVIHNVSLRTRILEFSFLPITFFSAIGIAYVFRKTGKIFPQLIKNRFIKATLALMFVSVFLPSTIFNAFPRYMYDPTYSSILHVEFSVAPEQQYALGRWVRVHINSIEGTVFSGSESTHTYVIGYGLFQGSWSLELINVTQIEEQKDDWNAIFYVVNEYHFRLPDSYGRQLDASTVSFLNENFNKIYDNDVIDLYNHD